MASARQVEQFRAGYDEIERLVRRDLTALWPRLRGSDPATIRNVWLEVMPALSDRYGAVALSMAAEWFETTTGLTATLADLTPTAAVQGSVRAGAGGLWVGQREDALRRVLASTVRHSLAPGRSTIARSARRNRMRYARAPEPGACAWCLMLSSRGAVYASEQAAGGGNDWHDKCRCVPEAAYEDGDLSYDVRSLYDQFKTTHRSGMNDSAAAAAMREAFDLR